MTWPCRTFFSLLVLAIACLICYHHFDPQTATMTMFVVNLGYLVLMFFILIFLAMFRGITLGYNYAMDEGGADMRGIFFFCMVSFLATVTAAGYWGLTGKLRGLYIFGWLVFAIITWRSGVAFIKRHQEVEGREDPIPINAKMVAASAAIIFVAMTTLMLTLIVW